MDRLYQKNQLTFSLAGIFGYLLFSSLADDLSRSMGTEKLLTAPVHLILVLLLYGFLHRNGLREACGLCAFRGKAGEYLYFLPLAVLVSVNLWSGVRPVSPVEAFLFAVSMMCVGFLEEVLFRGLLFRALCRDSFRTAVWVSSLTFGAGHLVNLLNGAGLLPTLLQAAYATAIGFLFTVLFCRSGSLWPCIIAHGLLNSLSILRPGPGAAEEQILQSAAVMVLCLVYALWLWRKTPKSALEG